MQKYSHIKDIEETYLRVKTYLNSNGLLSDLNSDQEYLESIEKFVSICKDDWNPKFNKPLILYFYKT